MVPDIIDVLSEDKFPNQIATLSNARMLPVPVAVKKQEL